MLSSGGCNLKLQSTFVTPKNIEVSDFDHMTKI